MKERTDIRAVELVRRIRDRQARLLEGKSNEEIIEFFREAAERFRAAGRARGRRATHTPRPARRGPRSR
ncbi:MAG: hypothetical protein HY812_00025 [Planctomycetes bacterium]|nr:hypothetical protein [Planctomycetota bacterium]